MSKSVPEEITGMFSGCAVLREGLSFLKKKNIVLSFNTEYLGYVLHSINHNETITLNEIISEKDLENLSINIFVFNNFKKAEAFYKSEFKKHTRNGIYVMDGSCAVMHIDDSLSDFPTLNVFSVIDTAGFSVDNVVLQRTNVNFYNDTFINVGYNLSKIELKFIKASELTDSDTAMATDMEGFNGTWWTVIKRVPFKNKLRLFHLENLNNNRICEDYEDLEHTINSTIKTALRNGFMLESCMIIQRHREDAYQYQLVSVEDLLHKVSARKLKKMISPFKGVFLLKEKFKSLR